MEITSVDSSKFPVLAFYLNVKNGDGRPIYGLDENNFTITEDSAPVKNFSASWLKNRAPSISAVFCIDRSAESKEHYNETIYISDLILKKMNKSDAVKITNFNGAIWHGNNFDWSRRRSIKALKEYRYGNGKNTGSVLYNAISDLAPRFTKRAVVLITDGSVAEDSFNRYSTRNIINFSREHYVPVYIFSFNEPHPYLKNIAEETGGAVFRPGRINNFKMLYEQIKKSEEYRYVLVYSTHKPEQYTTWWSDVKIEIKHKNQSGVEWGGYYVK
jgi:hypothetical protein